MKIKEIEYWTLKLFIDENRKKMKIILSLSGGIDSGTMIGYYLSKGHQVIPVNFIYGSKHNQYEQKCAVKLCEHYNIPMGLPSINLGFIGDLFKSDLLKSGGPISEKHSQTENMKSTIVPGRNLIFASILAGYAESTGADAIALGVHSGDYQIYPDCRPKFINSLKETINKSSDGKIDVLAPFLNLDKTWILKIGYGLPEKFRTPYKLTRTCYSDQEDSCGICMVCKERLEAFKDIGKTDPIKYHT